MDEIQDGVPSHRPPLVRIWLCGPFRIEWIDPITGEAFPAQHDGQGRDVAQTHALLKLLLCQPERQAHRDWIMEQFWPDHNSSLATHRIENICSSLRKLLTLLTGGESLLRSQRGRKNRGTLYTLAAYPQLWVDSDAIAWNVQQAARMDRFGDESLPFWQRAFDLLTRGPLLCDEPYAEWVTERREVHNGYYRQCVHALSQLYMARYGKAGKAEALLLLRTYWQQQKTDEDALRPMLELLGEQERYQEAEEYYQQFLLALAELNPTEDGKPRKPDARTSDIHDYLGTKQIQRERIIGTLSLGTPLSVRIQPQEVQTRKESLYPLSRMHSEQVKDGVVSLSSTQKNYYPFVLSSFTHLNTAQDALQTFEELLEGCWELSQGSNLKAAETLLWSHLPKVTEIELSFPEYQQKAASLAAQGYILAASLVGHYNGDLCSRQRFSEQALTYAQRVQDPNLFVAALRALGVTFDYQRRPIKALHIYQQALPFLDQVSPLLHARMCAVLAGAYAKIGQKEEAFNFLGQAYNTFPEIPQSDPSFLYADADYFTLIIWDGAVHLDNQQPEQALAIFLRAGETFSQKKELPKRIQSELLIYQTRAFIMLKNLEAASMYLTEAIKEASAIQSEIRYQQAHELFSQLQIIWPHEPYICALRDLFLR